AAMHSVPGKPTAVESRLLPCMPIPMMPKPMRSLGAFRLRCEGIVSGSRTKRLAATNAPVVPAVVCKNERREMGFLDISSSVIDEDVSTWFGSVQWLNTDFLEKHNIVVAVVLQANPTLVRPRASLWFKIEFAGRHWLTLGIVGHFYSIQFDDG